MSSYLDDLMKDIHQTAISKGWRDDERSFTEDIALIHHEASEALTEYRNGQDFDEVYFPDGTGKPEGIPIELADVIIRVLHTCAKRRISIEAAIKMKMEYNKTREHRHGGKLI